MKTYYNKLWMFMGVIAALNFSSCDDTEDPQTPPVAEFDFEATQLTVDFENKSEKATTFSWDFGDGTTSTDVSPSHTYAEYKKYQVKLIATSQDGLTDEISKEVDVVDPCAVWTGEQPNNVLLGGGFELCDEQYWTVVKSAQPQHASFEFAYTDYKPTDGEEGALYIHPDNTAVTEDEGTIMFQEITVAEGEYQLSALVKLGGEDKDNPESAMNNYWFQFYIGKQEPTDGTDYTEGPVSGWLYGDWTGWAYVVPPTDGPLVHDRLAANISTPEGTFNLDAGTYYMVIKFGKGAAGSFGDGIALDNLKLERIGDRDACFDWDGTQAGNLIKGGQMGECDIKYWTVLPANLDESPVTFGYTDYAPSTGDGKALYFSTPEESANAAGKGTAGTIYQYIGELQPGTYNISAQVKLGGVDGGMHQFWWEMYVASVEPVEGEEYQPKESDDAEAKKIRPIAGYTHAGWGPRADLGSGVAPVAVDGELQYGYNPYDQTDSNGDFEITEAGHYFFVFKFGTWEGSFGEGIAIDNLVITKK